MQIFDKEDCRVITEYKWKQGTVHQHIIYKKWSYFGLDVKKVTC